MSTDFTSPPIEQQRMVLRWIEDKTMHRRGKWTCPCGFIGGPRNIRAHRCGCETWRAYAFRLRWETVNGSP